MRGRQKSYRRNRVRMSIRKRRKEKERKSIEREKEYIGDREGKIKRYR